MTEDTSILPGAPAERPPACGTDPLGTEMLVLLRRLIAFPSVSGHERAVAEHLHAFARDASFTTDLWELSEH